MEILQSVLIAIFATETSLNVVIMLKFDHLLERKKILILAKSQQIKMRQFMNLN